MEKKSCLILFVVALTKFSNDHYVIKLTSFATSGSYEQTHDRK